MNLTNYEKTPIFRVFEIVKREAARYGVTVLESEIVGLVPSAALVAAAEWYLQLEGFTGDQVLEQRLRAAGPRLSVRSADRVTTLCRPRRRRRPSRLFGRAGAMPNARIFR